MIFLLKVYNSGMTNQTFQFLDRSGSRALWSLDVSYIDLIFHWRNEWEVAVSSEIIDYGNMLIVNYV